MSKRKDAPNSGSSQKHKHVKYRKDGTAIALSSFHPPVGPGIFVSCVRGKESQATREALEILNDVAERHFPNPIFEVSNPSSGAGGGVAGEEGAGRGEKEEEAEELDIQAQIAAELVELKPEGKEGKGKEGDGQPRIRKRFVNHQTGTQCLLFLEVRKPLDAVALVLKYLEEVEETRVCRTRYIERLTPISTLGPATLPSLTALATFTFQSGLDASASSPEQGLTYRIEPRARAHSTLTRDEILSVVGASVSHPHRVDLKAPERWLIVEIFKNVCGVAVVKDYDRFCKFNPKQVVDRAIKSSGAAGKEENAVGNMTKKEDQKAGSEGAALVEGAGEDHSAAVEEAEAT